MVWTETCAMEERMRFVLAVQEHEESFAAVCRRFGVSRRVGYKWLADRELRCSTTAHGRQYCRTLP